MASKPKPIPVQDPNYRKEVGDFVSAYGDILPDVLRFEQQYRPQFQGLNLGDISAFLQGTGGQQGLFGLAGTAAQQSQQDLQAARQAELAGMTSQTGAVRGLAQALSPEAAAQVNAATQEAARAYASANQLNPQEQRMAQQSAREAYASRGMLGSNSAVAAEILNRENVLNQKRAMAQQAGQGAYNLAQSFYTQPGYQMLSSAPTSYQTGLGLLSTALGSIGQGTPQLINPDMGFNLGAAQRQNVLQAQMANQSAKSAYNTGLMSLGGDIIKGAASIAAAGPTGGLSLLGLSSLGKPKGT